MAVREPYLSLDLFDLSKTFPGRGVEESVHVLDRISYRIENDPLEISGHYDERETMNDEECIGSFVHCPSFIVHSLISVS